MLNKTKLNLIMKNLPEVAEQLKEFSGLLSDQSNKDVFVNMVEDLKLVLDRVKIIKTGLSSLHKGKDETDVSGTTTSMGSKDSSSKNHSVEMLSNQNLVNVGMTSVSNTDDKD